MIEPRGEKVLNPSNQFVGLRRAETRSGYTWRRLSEQPLLVLPFFYHP